MSGENLAIVLGTVAALARRTGLGRRARPLVAGLALVAFVVLARPSPSVLRAAVMGSVVIVAGLIGRQSQPLPLLAFAVLALVVVDPFLARSPGFALSVLATGAIVLVAPGWTRRLSRRMPRPLAAAVAVPAAAQLACTPVIVTVFGQLTPFAIPANLLAAFAVAPATIAGVAAALVAVVVPPVSTLLAWLAALPAWWLATDARGFAALPGAGATVPPGHLKTVLGCVILACLVVGYRVVGRPALRARRERAGRAMLAAWRE